MSENFIHNNRIVLVNVGTSSAVAADVSTAGTAIDRSGYQNVTYIAAFGSALTSTGQVGFYVSEGSSSGACTGTISGSFVGSTEASAYVMYEISKPTDRWLQNTVSYSTADVFRCCFAILSNPTKGPITPSTSDGCASYELAIEPSTGSV